MSGPKPLHALILAIALCGGIAAPAVAQDAGNPAPVRQSVDGNGVNLFLGTMNVDAPALSIGGSSQGLSYHKLNRGTGWTDNLVATLTLNGSLLTVSLGDVSDSFTVSGSTYTPTEGNGATMAFNASTNIYTYVRADGTIIHFDRNLGPHAAAFGGEARVTDIAEPSGIKLTFGNASLTFCSASKQGATGQICLTHTMVFHPISVTSSLGYKLNFGYGPQPEFDPDDASSSPDFGIWNRIISVNAQNLAVSGSPTPSQSITTPSDYEVTDALGRVTKYASGASGITTITLPGSTSADVTVAYVSGRVSTVTTAAGTWAYGAPSDVSGVRTLTVTDPLSHVTTYTFNIASQRMTSMTDALTHTSQWLYDANGRLTKATAPEGNYVQYALDGRGNVTTTTAVAKSGSGLANIVTSAVYPTTCTNPVTCNKPTSTIDANSNETDYTYDATTGNVLTVIASAATTGGIHPTTTYGYTSYQAYYNNGTGIAASGQPVSLLTSISQCQTGATCVGAADEVKTIIGYGPQTAGIGNNLLSVLATKESGDATLVSTTAFAYDEIGNLISVDGPLAGTADTVTYRYDADREKVGVIAPDPDGAGTRKRAAQRITYDTRGRVTLAESGVVNGTDDTSWAAFAPAQSVTTTYDTANRKLTDTLRSGSTVYGVTQYSYDHHRLDCTATRMNSATWGTLPSDACTLQTTGTAGPDRITRVTTYDAIDRPLAVTTAYNTTDALIEATASYNSNGTKATLADAKGNLTSYSYDGFDRLVKTAYPVPSGTGSSTTDFEQLGYDPNGNVTSRRLRDTTSIAYTYDHLNRVTLEDLPGTDPDVTMGYDLLGRVTSAATSAQTLTFGYDALSRMTSQGGPLGTLAMQYDAAGERTRLTWPDTFYVSYDYDSAGNLLHIRENGAASGIGVLATYAYDDLGRRTSLTRGNATVTSSSYDAVSRLASFGQDLLGTTADLTLGFSYNPAGQIASTTRSNTAFAPSLIAKSLVYTVNGLNQATASGTDAIGYDSMGNVHTVDTDTYTYNHENLLLTGPNSTSYSYDPLQRLYQQSSSLAFAKLQYDGANMVAEYDATNALQKRYVFGAGTDAPLVEYDKSGGIFIRAWLHADERGSVVARSDDTGAATTINTYDEYGVPGSGNVGRFQYTGQAWLPELGVYYYKARLYSSRLGRFLQTDPIGYGDGLNWYNYVDGDPINGRDSAGTDAHYEWSCAGNCPTSFGYWNDPTGPAGGAANRAGSTSASGGDGKTSSGSSNDAGHYVYTGQPTTTDGNDIVVSVKKQWVSIESDSWLLGNPLGDAIFAYRHPYFVAGLGVAAAACVFGGCELLAGGAAAEGVEGTGTALTSYFPANNGFLGASSETTLEAGQTIDRYGGSAYSQFFSPQGVPAEMRALPPGVAEQGLRTFQVTQPFSVESGTVAPAFGQFGLGTQYRSSMTLGELLEQGYLSETTP